VPAHQRGQGPTLLAQTVFQRYSSPGHLPGRARAYYQLLNSAGQLAAAQASLTNGASRQTIGRGYRLQNGLATLPDVLEARSATAQAEYELSVTTGAQDIAQGNLAKALGGYPTLPIHVQPLDQARHPGCARRHR